MSSENKFFKFDEFAIQKTRRENKNIFIDIASFKNNFPLLCKLSGFKLILHLIVKAFNRVYVYFIKTHSDLIEKIYF